MPHWHAVTLRLCAANKFPCLTRSRDTLKKIAELCGAEGTCGAVLHLHQSAGSAPSKRAQIRGNTFQKFERYAQRRLISLFGLKETPYQVVEKKRFSAIIFSSSVLESSDSLADEFVATKRKKLQSRSTRKVWCPGSYIGPPYAL